MGDIPETERVNSYDALREYMLRTQIERGNWGRSTSIEAVTAKTVIQGADAAFRDQIYAATLEEGIRETFWMVREAYRFLNKKYARIRFPVNTKEEEQLYNLLTGQFGHFVHMSQDEPLYIAYTPDVNYGKADRRVKTTVGRYLKKYHGDKLSDADIRKLTDIYRYIFSVDDVQFATTPEDIARVYNSIHSCMGYKWSDGSENYGSQVHPTAAYATPDMRLAFMERQGKINARCLTWINPDDPSDKRYIRNYGDEVLLRKLSSMGYRQGNLDGAKLVKIPAIARDGRPLIDTYVVPYVDDMLTDRAAQRIFVRDDHLLVRSNSRGENYLGNANRTNGLLGRNHDYLRCHNDSYGIVDANGNRGMSPSEERTAKTCTCCGTWHSSESGDIVPTYEDASMWVCRECIGETKEYVFAYNRGGNQVTTLRANTLRLRDGEFVINTTDTISALSVEKLSDKYYSAGTYERSHKTRRLEDGSVISSSDAFVDFWEDIRFHINDKLRAHRGVILSKSRTNLPNGLFFDHVNGLVRSVPKANGIPDRFEPLRDWLIGHAAVTEPAERKASLAVKFKGENEDIVEYLAALQVHILTAEGRTNLLNEAVQPSLITAEETQ